MRSASHTSRDCLYLNIDAPYPATQPLPVMVWIFGGGYITGDASDQLFDGAILARTGLVIVRCNYRLGALGRNNLGLQDQIAALEWVRDNIADYGGDPNRVTLFGESSGAMSICNLLTVPSARGLFHAAIAQSGAGDRVATKQQGRLASAAWETAAAKLDNPDDPDQLMNLQNALSKKLRPRCGGMPFRPVNDGVLLLAHPEDSASTGADIPLIIGHNADEHRLYMNPLKRVSAAQIRTSLTHRLSDRILSELPGIYPGYSPMDLLAAVETELRYRQPIERYTRARFAARNSTTWRYRFNWPSPALRGWLGACHAIEIPFVFGNFQQRSTAKFVGPGHEAFSQAMIELWRHFAYHHRPPAHWGPYPQLLDIYPEQVSRLPDATEVFWNDALLNTSDTFTQELDNLSTFQPE
jgi:para-nitrobenzyl esterase